VAPPWNDATFYTGQCEIWLERILYGQPYQLILINFILWPTLALIVKGDGYRKSGTVKVQKLVKIAVFHWFFIHPRGQHSTVNGVKEPLFHANFFLDWCKGVVTVPAESIISAT